jgi:hypothetical protein
VRQGSSASSFPYTAATRAPPRFTGRPASRTKARACEGRKLDGEYDDVHIMGLIL